MSVNKISDSVWLERIENFIRDIYQEWKDLSYISNIGFFATKHKLPNNIASILCEIGLLEFVHKNSHHKNIYRWVHKEVIPADDVFREVMEGVKQFAPQYRKVKAITLTPEPPKPEVDTELRQEVNDLRKNYLDLYLKFSTLESAFTEILKKMTIPQASQS